jgi:hypothetical protein
VGRETINHLIHLIRGQRVILDSDLSVLYGVEVRILNQAVKRNIERFPSDFMFQLTEGEAKSLRSQFVILKSGRGAHRKYRQFAFTEQGVAMLSSVLKGKRAVLVNVGIMRAFVRLRQLTATSKALVEKLVELENKIEVHDGDIHAIFQAIRELMSPPKKAVPAIGFKVGEK